MALFDAASEGYELCELDGKLVAFTNMRLDRYTVPNGLYCYDIRDSDRLDGSCAEVKAHVMVNHWGTILCKSPFPLDEHGSYYPEDDMNLDGCLGIRGLKVWCRRKSLAEPGSARCPKGL